MERLLKAEEKAFKARWEKRNHITSGAIHPLMENRKLYYAKAIRVTLNLWSIFSIVVKRCPSHFDVLNVMKETERERKGGSWKNGKLVTISVQSIIFVNNNWILVRKMCDKFISPFESPSEHISKTKKNASFSFDKRQRCENDRIIRTFK